MTHLTDSEIGLRAQDIQTGLQNFDLKGTASDALDTTRLTGMAERLAVHIRGAEVIDNMERLSAVGSRLGIDSLVLPRVLEVLEEVEFVEVNKKGSRILKVLENIPYFSDLYSVMGSFWRSEDPSELEQATVGMLHKLSSAPMAEDNIRSDYPLSKADFKLVTDLGEAGGYLKNYEAPENGENILYSPLFWEENPERLYQLLKKYPAHEIAQAVQKVKLSQGFPLPDLTTTTTRSNEIILEAMKYGILPTPAVTSLAGKKYFAFSPYTGGISLSAVEKAVMQKARAILACIRYGEHYGTVTRISDPQLIIGALRSRRRIGPHSEIAQQYALLVVEGVGRIVPDSVYTGRYHFILIDNEDNLKALDIARDMLVVGESITDRGLDAHLKKFLFTPGTMQDPLTTIAETRQQISFSSETVKRSIDRLVDSVRTGNIG